jgi:hypothetical protein
MSLPPPVRRNKNDSGESYAVREGRCSAQLRLALRRKCKECGYPFTDRMLEVANFIAKPGASR